MKPRETPRLKGSSGRLTALRLRVDACLELPGRSVPALGQRVIVEAHFGVVPDADRDAMRCADTGNVDEVVIGIAEAGLIRRGEDPSGAVPALGQCPEAPRADRDAAGAARAGKAVEAGRTNLRRALRRPAPFAEPHDQRVRGRPRAETDRLANARGRAADVVEYGVALAANARHGAQAPAM